MQSPATQLKQSEASSIEYHWCKWIFDNLLNGCTPESMVKTINSGNAQNKAALIAEVYRVLKDPYLQAEKEMKHTLDKRNLLLDTCDNLAAFDPRYSIKIEKHAAPPFDDFVRNYYSKHMPEVFTGGFDHWSVRGKWTPSYFSSEWVAKKSKCNLISRKISNATQLAQVKTKMFMGNFCLFLGVFL